MFSRAPLHTGDLECHRDGVPAGGEDHHAKLDVVGEPSYPRTLRPPELGESRLGASTARRQGVGFTVLPTGRGALLQLEPLQLALKPAVDTACPYDPPVLVRPEVMVGTGFLGAHAEENG